MALAAMLYHLPHFANQLRSSNLTPGNISRGQRRAQPPGQEILPTSTLAPIHGLSFSATPGNKLADETPEHVQL